MALLGNILWFVFGGGFLLGLFWLFVGLLACCTIIGFPFGIACFRVAVFAFLPFGKQLIPAEYIGEKAVTGSTFGNIIWCVFCGLWLAIGHIMYGVGCCCTVIGIPFGLAHFKIAQAAFAPLGKRIVSKELAQAAILEYNQKKLAMMRDQGNNQSN